MTQLLPEVMRFKEVSKRFDPICYENYDDMQRTIFELILNNKEVVQ